MSRKDAHKQLPRTSLTKKSKLTNFFVFSHNYLLQPQVWNNGVSNFTADQLLNLGVISIGFAADDLAKMDLSSDEVIESLGEQPAASQGSVGYSVDQVT